MRLPPRPRLKSEVFTGAMADVSFLLIIFFMITAAFSVSKGMDLALPPPVDGRVDAWDSIDVHILADGTLEVDRKPMELGELLPYVHGKLAKNPEKPVILRSEPSTPYGAMIVALDELRQSSERMGFEIENLALPTFRDQQLYSIGLQEGGVHW